MTTLARFESFATDTAGTILASPTVEVRDENTAALVPLFSDRAGTSGITNPFTGGVDGSIRFHVAGGVYKVTVTVGGQTGTMRYVGIGTYSEKDFFQIDPAIAPTWTGLHTYTLNAGGLKTAGAPNQSAAYIGPSQKWGLIFDATAALGGPNQAESTMVVNMTSSVGSADPISSYKTALAAVCTANVGSADGWAQSNVMTVAYGNTGGALCHELDLNHFDTTAHSGTPAAPYIGNLVCTGTNTDGTHVGGYAHFAIGIQFAQNANPLWNYGIYGGPPGFAPFNTAFIFDESNSPSGYVMKGTKTTGIDLSNCTTANALFINNNSYILGYNQAKNSAISLLGVDTANNIILGQSTVIGQITSMQSFIPVTDNVYLLGMTGKRWAAVWSANGTIQTSDPALKTDIANLPQSLPLVEAIDPKTFKWIDGGNGNPGKRTHWGFLGPDVKKAFDDIGMDFGGYVLDKDNSHNLRPDQLTAVLWKAVQELSAEIKQLKKQKS